MRRAHLGCPGRTLSFLARLVPPLLAALVATVTTGGGWPR
jgi:hypothetical protein